jgi:hypothetical protein
MARAQSLTPTLMRALPLGLQIVGKARDDGAVLRLAYQYQQTTEHYERRPVASPLGVARAVHENARGDQMSDVSSEPGGCLAEAVSGNDSKERHPTTSRAAGRAVFLARQNVVENQMHYLTLQAVAGLSCDRGRCKLV